LNRNNICFFFCWDDIIVSYKPKQQPIWKLKTKTTWIRSQAKKRQEKKKKGMEKQMFASRVKGKSIETRTERVFIWQNKKPSKITNQPGFL
jgi:hypothetical protein